MDSSQQVTFNLTLKKAAIIAASTGAKAANTSSSSDTMTLYYYINEPPTYQVNDTQTNFVTDPVEGPFRGISNRYMSNSTFTSYTTDIISYISSRTPGNLELGMPDMYNEVLNINSEPYQDNYIQAAANYPDPGTGIETQVPTANFAVTTATGIFSNYKNITITYDNIDPRKTRVMVLSK